MPRPGTEPTTYVCAQTGIELKTFQLWDDAPSGLFFKVQKHLK